MDFRSLNYFVVVAQELNITRAAEKLNMSQPPLSSQIRNLEEELGVALFVRGKRQLTLTDAGSLLLRRASQMLGLADQTRSELASMTEGLSGTLFLSMVEGRAPFLAAEWIAGFHDEFPNVRYELWNGSSDDVIDQLRRGLADLAVVAAPFDMEHLDGIRVGAEPWVALISTRNPLSQLPGDTIPLRALEGQPLIIPRRKSRVEAIHHWFSQVGVSPQVLCEQSNYLDAVALSEQNVGISIFPQTTDNHSPALVSRVIVEPERTAEYYLVWDKAQQPGTLAQAFLDYVRDLQDDPAEP